MNKAGKSIVTGDKEIMKQMIASNGFNANTVHMHNVPRHPTYDQKYSDAYFAQGDNGGIGHNRYRNKGNDILMKKRHSNMRNIGYGISSSVKPKNMHLTYNDH